jgi:K(+)-stimulated pyrophosphate-energized sodium pump
VPTDIYVTLAAVSAVLALLLAAFYARQVLATSPGSTRMIELSAAIREGADAFLRREYTWMAGFVVVMAALIFVLLEYGRPWGALAYVFGALLSGGAGVVGMRIATAANARTTEAARRGGIRESLPLAFRGGAVMGFSVAGLGLLGVSLAYLVLVLWLRVDRPYDVIAALGLGGSSVALFARVGGGIFTKAADVGADLVGKVEAGIPEDDPRNPAVIADNVGDNVGDVAGMGADLFESYVGSLVAPIALAALAFSGPIQARAIVFPLAVGAMGMLASIVGSFLVRTTGDDLGAALRRGTYSASALAALGALGVSYLLFRGVEGVRSPFGLFLAVLIGLLVGQAIGQISEWFTSDRYKTVKEIARQAQTGPATVLLAGLAEGMRSAALSVIVAALGILGAFWAGTMAFEGGGIYGVAVAAIGVLATTGIVVSVDAYGPIADNAGGIAEMAGLPPEVRQATDSLDSLGNTTAAVAKGFAIGSAAITALALFAAFAEAAGLELIDLRRANTTAGLFLGAMFPFLFAGLAIKAVGRAANQMIEEVRRQFRDIPGLREGHPEARPEYARCVDIATASALREMIVPGSLAIILPLAIGFMDVEALGGFLAGALITGFLLAIFMANAGGAWDNAKKLIEAGAFGGKGSDAHKAAVIGDTVGDPFKDTAGPAMNILIKVMTITSLIFAGAF